MTYQSDNNLLWKTWREAARTPVINAAINQIYHDLSNDIAQHNPVCKETGRCCHFDTYDHRLYVTTLEVAWIELQLTTQNRAALQTADLPNIDNCPFQSNTKCTIHPIRPIGCRIFFCDPSTKHWQASLYEQYLARLRTIHNDHAIPYQYIEWRQALDAARVCC